VQLTITAQSTSD